MDGDQSLSRSIAPKQCFCAGNCVAGRAIALDQEGKREEAYAEARIAVIKAPRCPHTHAILGFLMCNTGHADYAEFQLSAAKQLGAEPTRIDMQLGYAALARGKLDIAESRFLSIWQAQVNNLEAWLGLARVYDAKGDWDRATEFAGNVYRAAPSMPMARITYARALAGAGDHPGAIDVLAGSTDTMDLFERGKLLERAGDYDQAFADYSLANISAGKIYDDGQAQQRIGSHKAFANRANLSRLPRMNGKPHFSPIFVTGYPRSGTTLTESILSAHQHIQAGDELPFIQSIAGMSQAWLSAPDPYPFSLNQLIIGDRAAVLSAFQAFYMAKARRIHDGESLFLTDKMPLNEMHLPLISLLFPQSPAVYVRRHPLDCVFSNFATYLTHGFNQAFALETAAIHYARVDDLVLHYRAKVQLEIHEILYEKLVRDPEPEIRRMVEFCGLEFDEKCLAPQDAKHHPRTPSYQAVKRPINDSSIGRWRNFEKHLGPAIARLEPILIREGY
jgi:Flp pilus assembly protein TadD